MILITSLKQLTTLKNISKNEVDISLFLGFTIFDNTYRIVISPKRNSKENNYF